MKLAGSVPGQGTGLGAGLVSGWGMWRSTADQCFSLTPMFLSLSFSLPFPLSKINEYNLYYKKKILLGFPLEP